MIDYTGHSKIVDFCLLFQSESAEQFEQDSKISIDKNKKYEIDEITVVATAMLMLVAGNLCRMLDIY